MDILKLDLNKATPDLPTENEIRFQVALLAAVPALIASFIARFLFDASTSLVQRDSLNCQR